MVGLIGLVPCYNARVLFLLNEKRTNDKYTKEVKVMLLCCPACGNSFHSNDENAKCDYWH